MQINLNLIEEIDINEHLIFKRKDEEGPDIKGGHVDALIVHATRNQKPSEGELPNFFDFSSLLILNLFSSIW